MIRESKLIDLEKLCIEEGKKVWTVFIDIYSMNADGNLLDVSGIGAIVALKNAKIPKYDKETGKTAHGEWTKESIPLKKDLPISITVHKIDGNFIVDPSLEEEDTSETRVTIGIIDGAIHSMQKGNSEALEVEEFEKILDLSEKVCKDIHSKLEKYLK
jgi:exosome complex component RRP42